MGTYLARPVLHRETEDGEGPARLRYAAASMQGWRLAQEDAHLALADFDLQRGLGLFAVFDGHCGSVVSELVSKLLPDKLRRAASYKAGDYPSALTEAFLAVDRHLDSSAGRRAVRQGAVRVRMELTEGFDIEGTLEDGASIVEALDDLCSDNPDGMGCTAVVALLEYANKERGTPMRLHVANCGDSRGVLFNVRGKCVPVSKDHKPRCMGERKRIEAEGGWVTSEGRIEGNLNLSRALGDFDYKRSRKQRPPEVQMISGVPEVRSRTLRPSDRFLLLGCDGVWETRRGSQATVEALRSLLPGGAAARRRKLSTTLSALLRDTCAEDTSTGLGLDNMTAVLVELPSSDAPGAGVRSAAGRSAAVKRPAAAARRKAARRQSR